MTGGARLPDDINTMFSPHSTLTPHDGTIYRRNDCHSHPRSKTCYLEEAEGAFSARSGLPGCSWPPVPLI
jgi:hypothetical protein